MKDGSSCDKLPAPLRDPGAAKPADVVAWGKAERVGEGTCEGQVLAIGPLSAPQLSGEDVLQTSTRELIPALPFLQIRPLHRLLMKEKLLGQAVVKQSRSLVHCRNKLLTR